MENWQVSVTSGVVEDCPASVTSDVMELSPHVGGVGNWWLSVVVFFFFSVACVPFLEKYNNATKFHSGVFWSQCKDNEKKVGNYFYRSSLFSFFLENIFQHFFKVKTNKWDAVSK